MPPRRLHVLHEHYRKRELSSERQEVHDRIFAALCRKPFSPQRLAEQVHSDTRARFSRDVILAEARALAGFGYLYAKQVSGGSATIYKIPPGKFERVKEHVEAISRARRPRDDQVFA